MVRQIDPSKSSRLSQSTPVTMQTMFWQKHYDQITVSTSSMASLELDEDLSAEFSKTEEEEVLQKKSLLDAKIERTIKTIETTKQQRWNSIEEGSTGLSMGSKHSNSDSCSLQKADNEGNKRLSDLSVSQHCPSVNKQKARTSDLSISEHSTPRPVPINQATDLDLNAWQQPPLKAANSRRRRKSTNDEPSIGDKRRARLHMVQSGRRRASIADVRGSNCRELASERVETRPRLRKLDSKRTLSNDSNSNEQQKGSTKSESSIQRSNSKKRLSNGSDSTDNSGISKQRLQRRSSSKTLSVQSNSIEMENQSAKRGPRMRRNGSRRELATEASGAIEARKSSLQSSLVRRRVASALTLSEYGNAHRNGGSKALAFRLSGNPNETFDQSPPETKNFTWSWREEETEPTLRRSNQSSVLSNTSSPSPMRKLSSRASLELDFMSSTPPSAKQTTRRLSMPESSDFTPKDLPMAPLKTAQRQREKKISPKRTSRCGDSLLSPGARRNSRAKDSLLSPGARRSSRAREHLVSPSYPKLPLATPDSKTKTNFKKTRGASLRRQASKSQAIALEANALDSPIVEDVVTKKDIGAIAQVLKESIEAEEELLRQKQEEREAKRSHVRARRRQTSLELTW